MNHSRSALAAFIIGSLLPLAAFAQDANPTVTSFTTSLSMIPSGSTIRFNWGIQNAYGVALQFDCPQGISVKSATGDVACGSRASQEPGTFDAAFTITNVSGASKLFMVTAYPKDQSGTVFNSGSISIPLTVDTIALPITDFSISTTTIANGGSLTLNWTGVSIPGTNLVIDCGPNASVYGPSGENLNCGVPAFTNDLAASGSLTLSATNTDPIFPTTINLRLIPSIVSGTYDATHGKSASFKINPKAAVPDATVESVAASTTVRSGATTTISWITQNASGANIELDCPSSLGIVGTSTALIQCGSLASPFALPANGSLDVVFTNTSFGNTSVNAIVMPQRLDGSFDRTHAKTVTFVVLNQQASDTPLSSTQTTATNSSSSLTSTTTAATAHYTFTKQLSRGSRGADVTALQQFLAINSAIYPEGTVSGFYGALTAQAVGRFQIKYNLAKAGDAGFGQVGPKTRAKLNSIVTP